MHPIQQALLELSRTQNLAKLTLREMAAAIGRGGESPQKIKHHLLQLQRRGFLGIDRARGLMERSASTAVVSQGLAKKSSLFSIPIVGTANCGPATLFAEENFQGFLRVSSALVGKAKPTGLYVIKADGSSMNRAEVRGKTIEDGDWVVVESAPGNIRSRDVVVAVVDNKATIKRFIDDRANGQIVLRADSSYDYEPIHLHPSDDFTISGKVVAVVKQPRGTNK